MVRQPIYKIFIERSGWLVVINKMNDHHVSSSSSVQLQHLRQFPVLTFKMTNDFLATELDCIVEVWRSALQMLSVVLLLSSLTSYISRLYFSSVGLLLFLSSRARYCGIF